MVRALVVAVVLFLSACSPMGSAPVGTASAAAVAAGEAAFAASCSECHGTAAQGTDQGPPLVDNVYRPGHHADGSFFVAVLRGVPQHHWRFGAMEPIDGVTEEGVTNIVAFVRQLQREAGIE